MELAHKHYVSRTQTFVTHVRKCRPPSHSLRANEQPTNKKLAIVIHRSIRSPKRTHPNNSKSKDSNNNLLSFSTILTNSQCQRGINQLPIVQNSTPWPRNKSRPATNIITSQLMVIPYCNHTEKELFDTTIPNSIDSKNNYNRSVREIENSDIKTNKPKYFRCKCSRLCVLASVFVALLILGILISVVAVLVLNTQKTATTTTTTTGTTLTTTTKTTTTTTTATSTTTSTTTTTKTTSTTSTTTTTTTTQTTSTTSATTTTTSSTTTSATTTTTTSTSTTTTQNPYACGNMTVLFGYDLFGSDINSSSLANYTLCCAWCQSYTGCVAFSWIVSGLFANICFLKNAVPSIITNFAEVSAYY